jgi:hypothetical protein
MVAFVISTNKKATNYQLIFFSYLRTPFYK